MDNLVLFPTIGIASFLLIVHLAVCLKKKITPGLAPILNIVLLASGLVCGVMLMVGCVYEPVMKRISELKLYIFIAAVAVLYISISELWKTVVPRPRRDQATTHGLKDNS